MMIAVMMVVVMMLMMMMVMIMMVMMMMVVMMMVMMIMVRQTGTGTATIKTCGLSAHFATAALLSQVHPFKH